jgi:glutamyl-tRNA synthetase
MPEEVRVRFAPSPTGYPHVGNIRTALFNWLFARHCGGKFIVRIEDTDVARTVAGAVEAILEGLRYLGMDWDEGPEKGGDYGPYYQSQRLKLYKDTADWLIEHGFAYKCYCSTERLDEMRKEQARLKQPPGYDRRCRNLSVDECGKIELQGIKPIVRFKVPLEGATTFTDLIRGEVTFEHATIDDLVLLKSDGYPTYHLANVIDDHYMGITHVMRAEEWLPSTPRHVLMYKALGWEPPKFAHLPIILGTDRSKLSKRHGAVSIMEYRDQGYLPEAMVNFLALLGWSFDDKTDVMSRDFIVQNFSIERISNVNAIFNKEKLDWMNGVYIRALNPLDFAQRAMTFLEKGLPVQVKRPLDFDYVKKITPLVQERAKLLSELPGLTGFFFLDELEYDTNLLISKGMTATSTISALETSKQRVEPFVKFDAASLEVVLRPLAEELSLKTGQLFGALRTAVTGLTATPPLFQTMEVLGKDRCMKRIDAAIVKLQKL